MQIPFSAHLWADSPCSHWLDLLLALRVVLDLLKHSLASEIRLSWVREWEIVLMEQHLRSVWATAFQVAKDVVMLMLVEAGFLQE